ncbi:hypothetical protein M406DRAFT_102527 [Cryphonectria parasitica EP155]|uniref:Uncharacterized protein n=1 Tax=Cryphonectria parasitica (strain ATCC 38755 / EP155) TaxID=660469 RepID=A0A9P5CNY3_CRYP1|nr:uncharacterized protein M406DRAFT_102527 [Cryphonectria parasitica EP155]KAF3764601.1 hypothetical protein M406DRAFT_102527 [Cryphonectria parasitica EP155]
MRRAVDSSNSSSNSTPTQSAPGLAKTRCGMDRGGRAAIGTLLCPALGQYRPGTGKTRLAAWFV